jgi:AraC-like DNA-binding protein
MLNELAAAVAAAQAEFSAIPKTADNPFFHSKYADLATVVLNTQPILAKHGLAVVQFPTTLDGEPALTTHLLHASGQSLSDTMKLFAAKHDPQGQGAAITYARRFAYMAVLGLVADDDDDGNTATRYKQNEAARPVKATPADRAREELLAVCKQFGLNSAEVAKRFNMDYGHPITKANAEVIEAFTEVVRDEAAVDAAADAEGTVP